MYQVILIDDDRKVCSCLKELIHWEEIGCHPPLIAYDGQQAIQTIQEVHIDFAICDIKMPILSGVEVMKYLGTHYPKIDIILLSGYEDFKTAQLAMKYKVKDYILKPINKEIINEIEYHLRELIFKRNNLVLFKEMVNGEFNSELKKRMQSFDKEGIKNLISRVDFETGDQEYMVLEHVMDYIEHVIGMDYETILYIKQDHIRKMKELNSHDRKKYLIDVCYKTMERQTRYSEVAKSLSYTVKESIDKNYSNPQFNVEKIANDLYFSTAHIGRVFVKDMGLTISEYLFQVRMNHAREYLKNSSLTVSEIAKRCGYSDANYFSKVFRRKYECSPREYRDNCVYLKEEI